MNGINCIYNAAVVFRYTTHRAPRSWIMDVYTMLNTVVSFEFFPPGISQWNPRVTAHR